MRHHFGAAVEHLLPSRRWLLTATIFAALAATFAIYSASARADCNSADQCFGSAQLRSEAAKQKFDQGFFQREASNQSFSKGVWHREISKQKFNEGVFRQAVAKQRFNEGLILRAKSEALYKLGSCCWHEAKLNAEAAQRKFNESVFLSEAAKGNFREASFYSAVADGNFREASFYSAAANGSFNESSFFSAASAGDFGRGLFIQNLVEEQESGGDADSGPDAAGSAGTRSAAAAPQPYCKQGPQIVFRSFAALGDLRVGRWCHQGTRVFGVNFTHKQDVLRPLVNDRLFVEDGTDVDARPYNWKGRGIESGYRIGVLHNFKKCIPATVNGQSIPVIGGKCYGSAKIALRAYLHEDGSCFMSANMVQDVGPDISRRTRASCGSFNLP